MTLNRIMMIKAVSAIFLLLPVLAGCVAPGSIRPHSISTVRPGSIADVRFICSLQNGDIVAATDKSVGENTVLKKSPVFLSRVEDGPVSVTASSQLPGPTGVKELAFENEIITRMAGLVTGMKEGEKRIVELKAEDIPERRQEDYVIKIARVRERVKEMSMTAAEYLSRTGKSPEEGQPFVIDPVIPGRVKRVTQDEVTILFSARPGEVVKTPFGAGHIKETENAYEIEIDSGKETLVRSGHLVGRISGVDDNYITIDYRNPFGGETLFCEVTVEKVSEAKPAKAATGK